MIRNINQAIISKLTLQPNVTGIIVYGNHVNGNDIDICVLLEDSPNIIDIESLHFFFEGKPVDLSVREKNYFKKNNFISIDFAIVNGNIVYDKVGDLKDDILKSKNLFRSYDSISEHKASWEKFHRFHLLDKVINNTDELYRSIMLSANIYWIIEAYFSSRSLPKIGAKKALMYFKINDQDFLELLKLFFKSKKISEKIQITKNLTEKALQPVGGVWKNEEVLVFGRNDINDINQKGLELYKSFFS